jgi:tetratricopeptide (TPR) repeat protein
MQNNNDLFDSEELLAFARLDIERGDLERGLGKLKRAATEADVAPTVHVMMAGVYAQMRLFDRAKGLYQRYLALVPGDVQARLSLGMTELDSGRPAEALAAWEELLRVAPGHPPALYYRAVALAEMGKRPEAIATLDGLLGSVPEDNLFFERAKELRGRLEAEGSKKGNARGPVGGYRTEH